MPKNIDFMSNNPDLFTDGLSAILSRLGLKAEISQHADLCGQWAIDTSGLRKASFHLVERGSGWLHTIDSKTPRLVNSGDFIIFPHDASHCISSSPLLPDKALINQVQKNSTGQMTSLLCGYFEFTNPNAWPLLDSLPDTIVLDLKEGGVNNSTFLLVQLIITELKQTRPGFGTALNQLAYLLFIQVLRSQIESGISAGLLLALADKNIGIALNNLHVNYTEDWTVSSLAKKAGMSRSVFSEKFVSMVGKTPMRYLAEWRMQEASVLLKTTDTSVSIVAGQVGYNSEIAFRKAYKKLMHETPGKTRRNNLIKRLKP